MSDSLQPHRLAYQAPLSMEFPRQEYWSGLPFPSPGNLPHPGIELRSPALQVDSLPLYHPPPPAKKKKNSITKKEKKKRNTVVIYKLTSQSKPH